MGCMSKGKLCALVSTMIVATLAAIAVVVVLILTTSDTDDTGTFDNIFPFLIFRKGEKWHPVIMLVSSKKCTRMLSKI